MVLGSNMSIQKTFYEVLSVSEDASYDEIRAAYKSAALNTHPDKAHTTPESSVPSSEQEEFFMVQKAWEILRHPASRADYDKQLQSSKQNIEIIASEIEVRDMIVESTADTVELLYPCRCGDYFSITSCELGDMGIFVSGDGEVEHQVSDSASASVILGCGSCSLKVRTLSSVYTIECISSTETGPVAPPVFIFVVDTCMIEEEIDYLKYALEQAVELLPDNSLVGFITFGTYVQVHELGFGLLPKSYVFKGTKEVTKEQMCFFSGKKMPTTGVIAGTRDGLSSVIEEMQKDPWPVPADQRASSHQGALELP